MSLSVGKNAIEMCHADSLALATYAWIKKPFLKSDPQYRMIELQEAHRKATTSLYILSAGYEVDPKIIEIEQMRRYLLRHVSDKIAYWALKQVIIMAKPEIPSQVSLKRENSIESGIRKVITLLRQKYPKNQGLLIATKITAQITTFFLPKSWKVVN